MQYFQSYKGRSIANGQRVKVYFNLHKEKYSAVAMDGEYKGKVLGHFDELALRDVVFTVSEAGRQRVIREKKKNVHAYAIGQIAFTNFPCVTPGWAKIVYNPYKMSRFYAYPHHASTRRRLEHFPIVGAAMVHFGWCTQYGIKRPWIMGGVASSHWVDRSLWCSTCRVPCACNA